MNDSVLKFDLDELEADSLAFDLDDLDAALLKYDLDEPEEAAGEPVPEEPGEEALEFIELDGLRPFFREPENYLPPWRRAASVAFGCLALSGAIFTLAMAGRTFVEELRSEQKVTALREEMQGNKKGEAAPEPDKPEQEILQENPYAEAFVQNGDMAAWLVIGDTVIDYPVMQTMEDEEYYLNRDFYGNDDKSGCLILDTGSLLEDASPTTNLIIHGHNMKLGTMFGSLDEYKNETYFQEHRYIELYTEGELRRYEVMAAFNSQVYYSTDKVFKYYNFFHADTGEEFSDFYDNIKAMSLYDTGVEAQLGDHFLTLSTCAYHVTDGRFVVVAKETGRQKMYYVP